MATTEMTNQTRTFSRRDFLHLAFALPVVVGTSALLPDEAYAATKPAKTAITNWAPFSKKIKLRWKKVSGARGYQVKVYTNNKFKKCVKTKYVKGTVVTLTGLGAAKYYCVRVRAFKKVGSKKVFGAWSSAKIMHTKVNPIWPSDISGQYASGETLGYTTIVLRYRAAMGLPGVSASWLSGKDGAVKLLLANGSYKYYVVDFDKGSIYAGKCYSDPMTGSWTRRGKLLCK